MGRAWGSGDGDPRGQTEPFEEPEQPLTEAGLTAE